VSQAPSVLLVGNWDSSVGYAWWLMESFWVRLAERYRADHRVLLAYPSISTLSPTIQAAPLEAAALDFRSKSIPALLGQCRFLRRHRVRLMYLSDWGTWSWRYLLFRLCGVRRIVVHDHTPGERTRPRGVKKWLKLAVNRLPWLAADGAIGATDYVRDRLVEVSGFPARRCFSAPNGLPADSEPELKTPAPIRDLFSIPPDRAVMVMTGRANRYKNVQFVIECMAELRKQGRRDLHFLFIGDGPDLEAFTAQADGSGVADFCSFPGRREDVPQVLQACDFAIHPSSGEVGYSLSILEYMQAGLPVLVPDNPSVSGATDDGRTGLVFRRNDRPSAVMAITRLLDEPEPRKAMGEEARHQVHKRFRLEETHRALMAAFDSIDGEVD